MKPDPVWDEIRRKREHLERVREIQDAVARLVPSGWKFALTIFCNPPLWEELHHTTNVELERWTDALTTIAERTLGTAPGTPPSALPERKP